MLPVDNFPNYLMFHRVDGAVIRVLCVVHGVRDLPQLSAAPGNSLRA